MGTFGRLNWVFFIDGCLYGLPVIITLFTYFKSPKHCKDYFLFQYEFKISSILMSITISIYLTAQIVSYFSMFMSDIMILSVSMNPALLSLISTLWITHKILSKNVWRKKKYKNKNNKQHDNVMAVI